uniref:Proprotein convertase subtilisin/kexin type 5-like n=1 Tax=Saccoglossus kowalevskii TaxID=10224 RepID=A0ABM0MVU5_SACKO|nr:PREDICTED: proprotein convertase subtilisin/kexin type 5-like [Saccoglossus kowalevskii]
MTEEMKWLIAVFIVSVFIVYSYSDEYTNEFAVHIIGGSNVADRLAKKHGYTNIGQIGSLNDYYLFEAKDVPQMEKRLDFGKHLPLKNEINVDWLEQQIVLNRNKRDDIGVFTDPLWEDEWYLNRDGLTMKVKGAWDVGYTGKGTVVTIVDDGLEKDHPDLVDNYDQYASTDLNDRDPDPQPRATPNNFNNHGTRCAGVVAMRPNNSICGVGVAYNAHIGGIRALDGRVTDSLEAASVSHNPQHVDIYSSSWGPHDDGKTVDGPRRLGKRAFIDGVTSGRSGKGSIFVFASGNGGVNEDNCNYDGYQSSIYTISISSTNEQGTKPGYVEKCSAVLTTTYSSGDKFDGTREICSSDEHHKCTKHHTGTSASAPLAAGIIALALEANPDLTWRDVQHIIVRTSKRYNLQDNEEGWTTNAAGFEVSHLYGFGLMDAEHMVRMANMWKESPAQHLCNFSSKTAREISGTNTLIVTQEVDICTSASGIVNYVEHVQVILSTQFTKRGDLLFELISPSGTRSVLLSPRKLDNSTNGLNEWVTMTTHCWGEKSEGTWTLEINNRGDTSNSGKLLSWSLVLYGTDIQLGSVQYER